MLEEAAPAARPTPLFSRHRVRVLLTLFGLLVVVSSLAAPNLVELVTAQPTTLHVGKCEPSSDREGPSCSVTWTVDGHHGHREIHDLDPNQTIPGWATSYDATSSRFTWYLLPSSMCLFDGIAIHALLAMLITSYWRRRGLPTANILAGLPASLFSSFGLLTGMAVGTRIGETLNRFSTTSPTTQWVAAIAFPLGGILLDGLVLLYVLRPRPA